MRVAERSLSRRTRGTQAGRVPVVGNEFMAGGCKNKVVGRGRCSGLGKTGRDSWEFLPSAANREGGPRPGFRGQDCPSGYRKQSGWLREFRFFHQGAFRG